MMNRPWLMWIAGLMLCGLSRAGSVLPVDLTAERQANTTIALLYQQPQLASQPLANRILSWSAYFLGRVYRLGALGEGTAGQFDQFPRYRTDAFDCLTYVETVMALALAHHIDSFKQCLSVIRYHKGKVTFMTRNHFTDLDWNTNNQAQGLLHDMTTTIHDRAHHSVAKIATANINKSAWYQHMTLDRIRLRQASIEKQQQRLQILKQRGAVLPERTASIAYIPLSVLIDASGKGDAYLLHQIPSAAVIEIVRPNWDLTAEIGTHLNVSHLGFAVWRAGVLYFRNASTLRGAVVDQPLVDYLVEQRKKPTVQGINIQVVLDQPC